MNKKMFIKLMLLNISISVFLAACSTPIKQAGEEHATAIGKWNELARYAETKFINYPVAITAQLALVKQDAAHAYQLRNIQLSKKENSYTINLLAPNFEHKYICSPICYQLLEYVENSPTSGSTLLNEYFALHEFELFSFYGELYKMNEKLDQLSRYNASGLNDYLHYISHENRQFQALDSFASYLSDHLDIANYQAFLDDPKAKTLREKSSQVGSIFKQALDANAGWSYPSASKSPEIHLWQHLQAGETSNWMLLPESNNWLASDFKPKHAKELPSDNVVSGAWLMAKNIDLQPNSYVCSYSDNKFGRLARMSNNNVEVELIGQAKLLQDGILYDLEEGALFNGHPSISFLPLQGTQSFSSLNVAMCQPE